MKCECSLQEFVKRYPCFRSAFSNLLSDKNYIVKFFVDKDGYFYKGLEVGYKEDKWLFD